jgi:hypothetical protein
MSSMVKYVLTQGSDTQAAKFERACQDIDVSRVLVPDAAAFEARECHLTHALLERNADVDGEKVVVPPECRCDPQPDLLGVQSYVGNAHRAIPLVGSRIVARW